MAIPFATNPAVHWDAKAKMWRMLVIKTGGPASKQHHCGPRESEAKAARESQLSARMSEARLSEGNGTNQLYSTPSLSEGWSVTPASFPGCNNPTGAVDSEGTAWLLCHNGPGFHLYSAFAGWSAAAAGWTLHGNILHAGDGVRAGACEDPSMCENRRLPLPPALRRPPPLEGAGLALLAPLLARECCESAPRGVS